MDTSNSPFAAQAGAAPSGTDSIDFSHYLRLILHNKWKIAAFVCAVTALVVVLVKPLPSEYEARSTVMIETSRSNVIGIEDIYGTNTQNREYLATQYEIIRSRALKERVVDRLRLTTHPEFDPRQQEESKPLFPFLKKEEEEVQLPEEEIEIGIRRDLVSLLETSLIVEPLFGTHLVSIAFKSNDPDLAADVVNALADVYIESHLEAKLAATKKATGWLGDRLGELRQNLQDSEERLQSYKEEEQLVDIQGVRTLDAAELTQLREDYVDARQARTEAEVLFNQVRNANNLTTDQLLGIPAIFNNPVIQRLIESKGVADRRVAELSGRYGAKHPVMVAALSEQQKLQEELGSRISIVSQGLDASYRAALQNERSLSRQIDSTQSRLQTVGRKEVRLRELEREVQTNRQLYDLFLSRGKETDESVRLEEPPARVIDAALPPTIPVGPDKKKFVIGALVMALGLSIGLIILLDLLDASIRTADDVEHKLKISMLGFLPLDKSNKSRYAFRGFVNKSDDSGFAESIRSVRTSLVLSSLDKPFKRIVVTSSVPDEGKSTVALNLAEAFSQMEKILLIDADMRKPTMAKALGFASSTLGLSNIIAEGASIESCIHTIPDSEIDVIFSGTIPNNPLELLSSMKFKTILEALDKRYDRIVIDSAPVHVVSDAKVLSSYADSVVYIVKSNVTQSSIAAKGIKMLRSVNAPLTGAVLNHVDIKKSSQYDTFYGAYAQNYKYAETAKD